MDVKTLDEAIKLQDEFATRLLENMNVLNTGKPPSTGDFISGKKTLLAAAQVELETAMRARDEVTSRWNDLVARRQATVESLQQDLDGTDGGNRGPIRPIQPKTRSTRKRTGSPR